MQPNYGMIQSQISEANIQESTSLCAVSLTQTLALEQWMQSLQSLSLPEQRQTTHYTQDRSPLELRLYALFAD